MTDNIKAEALLLSENLATHMNPVIKRLTQEVNSIVEPVTKLLRNELKEGIRRVDSISSDLKKQLDDFEKLNKEATQSLGAAASQVSEVNINMASIIKAELDEQLKPVAHGLVNDIRQATVDERERLKQSLEGVIVEADNAIIKLQQSKSHWRKALDLMVPVVLAVSATLATLFIYDATTNPLTNLSEKDQTTYATGKMFEKVWPNLSEKQRDEYRRLASGV